MTYMSLDVVFIYKNKTSSIPIVRIVLRIYSKKMIERYKEIYSNGLIDYPINNQR